MEIEFMRERDDGIHEKKANEDTTKGRKGDGRSGSSCHLSADGTRRVSLLEYHFHVTSSGCVQEGQVLSAVASGITRNFAVQNKLIYFLGS
jgi:hypothetical protein